jgi:hypothetical protein
MDHDQTNEKVVEILDNLKINFNEKAININHVLVNMGSDESELKGEIERLQQRAKLIKNRKENLKEYLRYNMEKTKINNIKCPLFNITLGKPSPTLIIDDLELIPLEYKELIVTHKAKSAELLRALKDGEQIPGCHLGQSKSKLIIK